MVKRRVVVPAFPSASLTSLIVTWHSNLRSCRWLLSPQPFPGRGVAVGQGVAVGVFVGVLVGGTGVSVGVFVGVSLATGPFTELDEARLRQPGAGVGTGAGEALPAFANAETTVAAATAAANRR